MKIFAEVQLREWNSENTCRIYACLSVVKIILSPSSLKEPVLPQPSLQTPGRNPGIHLALQHFGGICLHFFPRGYRVGEKKFLR